jgi:uridine phosphorylase
MDVPYTTGVGIAGDAFYAPRDENMQQKIKDSQIVSIEMESDTLFIIGQYRGWRTGALYTSDGTAHEVKPEWGWEKYYHGEANCLKIALDGMLALAEMDKADS